MNGQWMGVYSGTNAGIVVADLDDVGATYSGVVFVYDNNTSLPYAFAYVELPKDRTKLSLRINWVHSKRGLFEALTKEQLAQMLPGTQMPTYADRMGH
jgi:hypothetical protein